MKEQTMLCLKCFIIGSSIEEINLEYDAELYRMVLDVIYLIPVFFLSEWKQLPLPAWKTDLYCFREQRTSVSTKVIAAHIYSSNCIIIGSETKSPHQLMTTKKRIAQACSLIMQLLNSNKSTDCYLITFEPMRVWALTVIFIVSHFRVSLSPGTQSHFQDLSCPSVNQEILKREINRWETKSTP